MIDLGSDWLTWLLIVAAAGVLIATFAVTWALGHFAAQRGKLTGTGRVPDRLSIKHGYMIPDDDGEVIKCLVHGVALEDENGYHGYCPACEALI